MCAFYVLLTLWVSDGHSGHPQRATASDQHSKRQRPQLRTVTEVEEEVEEEEHPEIIKQILLIYKMIYV